MAVIILQSITVVAGVATHLGFFKHGEHHMYGAQYLQLFFAVFFTAISALIGGAGMTSRQAFVTVDTFASLYLVGLYGSLVIYRIFFSPLKGFPGPFLSKITNLNFSARLKNSDAHEKVLTLHRKYGHFVRLGSSDLSIAHPKAANVIYGRGSKCTKADWYDLTLPLTSMQTTRKRTEHDKRRRIWGRAFNDNVIRDYEKRITFHQNQLLAKISASYEKPIDVTQLYNHFTYDVMGDLAFDTSFNMLQNSEEHWAIRLLHKGVEPLGLMLPTWCFRLLLTIPGASGNWFAFQDYCCQRLDDRMKTRAANSTITSFLLEPWQDKKPVDSDLKMLQGDSQLIIVAGRPVHTFSIDTTASALTSIFYELVKEPDLILRLREELIPLLESGDGTTNQNLQSLNLLNGVINETLRLHPPTGVALQRKAPSEGLTIGDSFIPGDTTVWCSQYVIGRSEDVYTDALRFLPERWYASPEMIKEPSAYAPFSLGTYNCIGKSLALLALRTSLAKLVLNFDISFAPNEDGTAFEKEARTQFTTRPGPLHLKFRPRRI